MGFVHLHTHSEFSLLDGANRIPDLVASAAAMGMPALALTDHGNLFGAIHFYDACRAAGIKPLLGFEAYVAPGSRREREGRMGQYAHLLLLAETLEGYRNLLRLSSIGYLEGFYYRPRIDKEVLREHAAGLIATSACLKGEVAARLLEDDWARARAAAAELAGIFGERSFFLEIQDHGVPEQARVNEGMRQLARELGLGLVCTNDVHYLRREDAAAHDVLLCIQTGKTLDEEARMRFHSDDFYFKSPEEMAERFRDLPEALANTVEIAKRCNVELEFKTHLPAFPLPADATSADEHLCREARAGLAERLGAEVPPEYAERLEYELEVIRRTGYSGYFLIVQDFMRAARERAIPVGPGRGSVGGSLVAYALRITDLDPLRYGLIFERFLNPERISMPDIDIDFCFERRGEVIQYVKQKYGESNVAQIITFGTMKARAAVRDVARVLQIPLAEADHIAKLIPNAPGFSMEIAEAAEKVAEIHTLFESGGIYRRLIDNSRSLEGLSRHASVHAAGIVITPTELWNYVPLYRSDRSELTTQWDMNAVERAGLLKMDFLGLKTLTVLHYVCDELAAQGIRVDLEKLPEDDPATLRMLGEGKTEGVFQFEGNVPTDVLRRMKPDTFEDLVAVNALIRPGPLDSGMTDAFIRRKRGLEVIRYPHKDLEPILRNTYGVITYQEDVLKIAQVMAGFTLAQADVMRKAMGKKIQALIDEQVRNFIEGAVARGYERRVAREVADQIVTFGRYGFNRAHAVGYTILSYRTAYLKRHYPVQYMAALLSSEMGNTDKVVRYIATCRSMGIEVLPPDVNESRLRFTSVAGGIRFGLGAIKNVGRGAVESVLEARERGGPFTSLFDLCERIDLRHVNKRVIECLIMAGALDSLGGHRAQLLQVLDAALAHGQRKQDERRAGQFSLFGESAPAAPPAGAAAPGEPGGPAGNGAAGRGVTAPPASPRGEALPPLPEVPAWSRAERLQKEKELIGFYVSGHPLDRYRTLMRHFETVDAVRVPELAERANGGGLIEVTLAGLVTALRLLRDRKGNLMAFATLEDLTGTVECILFNEIFQASRELVQSDRPVLLRGTLSSKGEDDLKVIAAQIVPLDQAARLLELHVPRERLEAQPDLLLELRQLLVQNSGTTPVTICITGDGVESCLRPRALQVAATSRLLDALAARVGHEAIRLVSPLEGERRPTEPARWSAEPARGPETARSPRPTGRGGPGNGRVS